MSAEMATKVQSKIYFPSSMIDLNNGLCNGMWDQYHDNRTERSPFNDPYLMGQTMDGYPGYPNLKEQIKQTILKQESIFRHQLQELHRVYNRQRDLMNEFTMKAEAPKSCHFLSQVSSRIPNEMHTQRRVIDLELPADVEDDNVKICDLNEPIQVEEASFINKNYDKKQDLSANLNSGVCSYLQTEPKKPFEQLSRKRRIFGVEICESSHTPSFDSSQSFSSKQIPDYFACNKHANSSNSRFMTIDKNNILDEKKGNKLPHWLMKTKEKETKIYQMNLDSLQQHSHQFFKKVEKVQTDNRHEITKILGFPIINVPDNSKHAIKENGTNNQIDLNLSFDEEEDHSSTPLIPESVIKIASMEIDLEAPAALEPESDDVFVNEHEELARNAAEAIVVISYLDTPTDTLLKWFAEVITSNEECMDEFEYMSLKLQETDKMHECCKPMIMEDKEEEEDENLLKKRGSRKRGRQRKDFQRDVLPGIVSLSRREVSEDLQTFEEAFSGIGVSWQSKRKSGGGKNGRGRRRRRRLAVPTPPPSPPPLSPSPEQSVCREVALEEKSLSGWGKRTRRLPRQRCQNGGGNHHSLALKC